MESAWSELDLNDLDGGPLKLPHERLARSCKGFTAPQRLEGVPPPHFCLYNVHPSNYDHSASTSLSGMSKLSPSQGEGKLALKV